MQKKGKYELIIPPLAITYPLPGFLWPTFLFFHAGKKRKQKKGKYELIIPPLAITYPLPRFL